MKRIQLEVRGQVQGVGFRPRVFQLAKAMALTGWVKNTAAGVLIEVQGKAAADFWSRLAAELPPLAEVDELRSLDLPLLATESAFTILPSEPGLAQTRIPPDLAICQACLAELFDPEDHYYRYPFTNCTHCGPRFSLIKALPYDRPLTAMADFPLCGHCQNAYEDPNNRRYHAQPIACADCGPQLSHGLEEISAALVAGKIVALKGLGGYQIICDANNAKTLARLRENKRRPAKPFALMVLNLPSAEPWVEMDPEAQRALQAAERPIVLLRKKISPLPELIAPGLSDLGIMLPATPLHYLLFHALCGYPQGRDWLLQAQPVVLVVTSANLAGEPLIYQDDMAKTELAAVADLIVSYNRDIVNPVDDSVLKVIAGRPRLFRRARGYAPRPISLPKEIPPTLASVTNASTCMAACPS